MSSDEIFNNYWREFYEPGSYEANFGFAGTLVNNDMHLLDVSTEIIKNINLDEFKRQIVLDINAGVINSETMCQEWCDGLLYSIDWNYLVFKHACIYSVLAEIAYNNSEIEKAWSLLANSCYLCGGARSYKYNAYIGGDTKQRENARKGGKKRGDAYLPVRQEIINILLNPPDGGWKGSLPTRKFIVKALEEFEKKMKSSRTDFSFPTNISAALSRWFTDCSEIREAYEANTAEAISGPLN